MKLYIYEHCPFCVMTKMIFVLKQQPVEVEYLLYDNVQMPMKMTGRKLLPILEYKPRRFMPESMDIIHYVDGIDQHSKVTLPIDPNITEWIHQLQRFIYRLTYPRWVKAPFPELSTDHSRRYFLQSKDPSGKGFVSDFADPALKQRAQKALDQLENILQDYPLLDAKRLLSVNDFYLFANLHSLSIIAGLTYGALTEKWRQEASKTCLISLHDEFAT